jgi:hypothetical protein
MSASPGRRFLLLAAAACGAQAPAKLSRADAGYQDAPRSGLSCLACTFFRRPASCQVVDGEVSPHGWCRLFDMPD